MSTKLFKQKEIEKILGVKIKNKNIWLTALTHKSWLFFHPEAKLEDNERLEFLGDSVLQTITSWYLYLKFPEMSEGEMSLVRASLINRNRLGKIAKTMGIDKILLFGKNLDDKGLRTVLGNSLEAIIGAIFLDLGFEEAKEFIKKNILKDVDEIVKLKKYKDPKSSLQEIFQKEYGELPEYELVEVSGPPHQRNFKVALYLKGKKLAEAEGTSKKEAEINAAIKALEII